ncbi:hypothetical protein J4414_00910 [Candidatus Woesearchaeota archaeon]|nr:hypothetical protein [Candidatus Woesearchaeota archaeon]
MEFQAKTKKWGSSLGIIIPKTIVEKSEVKPNENVTLDLKKTHKAKEFFGLLKEWKKTEQKIKDEARSGWE